MDATELVFLMVKSITLKQVTNGFFPLTYKRCSKTKKIYQEISFFRLLQRTMIILHQKAAQTQIYNSLELND